jgi:hypothetical protein
MKKLQVNMVFRNTKDNIDFRIIHISYDYSDIVCINLNNEKALPYCDNTANVESQVANNELEVLENDPYLKIFDESAIQDRYLKARDIAFEYIKELCSSDNIPRLYNEKFRSNLISEISKDFTTSKVTIYKNFAISNFTLKK